MYRIRAHRTTYAAVALASAVALTMTACGSSSGGGNPLTKKASKGSVVIGAANFYESDLLATIYQQALAAKGIKATTKLNIGAREVYYPEVKKGALTIVPEYNGTLLTTEVNTKSTAVTTAQVDQALASGLPSTLKVLNPSAAQDADSVTVTQATATRDHLKSIADLKPYASKMVFGGPPEFATRSDGIPGLKKNYGLTFKSYTHTDESSTLTFLDLTKGKVQAADVFTTSPQIITDHLVSLSDPKNNFAAQNVIPLVYKPGVNATITGILNQISAKLTTSNLLQMDKALVINHASYSSVASGFLKAQGIG